MEATMVINSGPIEACRACLASRCLPIVMTAATNTFKSSCTRDGNSLGDNKETVKAGRRRRPYLFLRREDVSEKSGVLRKICSSMS